MSTDALTVERWIGEGIIKCAHIVLSSRIHRPASRTVPPRNRSSWVRFVLYVPGIRSRSTERCRCETFQERRLSVVAEKQPSGKCALCACQNELRGCFGVMGSQAGMEAYRLINAENGPSGAVLTASLPRRVRMAFVAHRNGPLAAALSVSNCTPRLATSDLSVFFASSADFTRTGAV
jgi:hypothetical protein